MTRRRPLRIPSRRPRVPLARRVRGTLPLGSPPRGRCLGADGARDVNDLLGAATLRTVEYRGVSTATMVYDKHPIFDHFRRVDADTVLGLMDRKGEPAPLAFFLTRR